MITVGNLVFEYPGKRILDGISFILPAHSVTALIGANGIGKTTLMRCLSALHTPFSGTITIDGVDAVENPRQVHEKLGYLSDFFGLYDDLSVGFCLAHAAAMRGVDAHSIESRVQKTAERLGLNRRLHEKAGGLSRGYRQRLGVAQAIIHEPQALLLDEPASGLDPHARQELSDLINTLREQGMTIVVSSHILAELEAYSTHILTLSGPRECHFTNAESFTQTPRRTLLMTLADAPADLAQRLDAETRMQRVEIDQNRIRFQFEGSDSERHALLKGLMDQGLPICGLCEERVNFSTAYLAHTDQNPPDDNRNDSTEIGGVAQ